MRNTVIASTCALAICCLAARVEQITIDLERPKQAFTLQLTEDTDATIRATLRASGAEFDPSGWTGLLWYGTSQGGLTLTNSAAEYGSMEWTVARSAAPTNGRYAVQILGTKGALTEEWGSGALTVRLSPSSGTLPAEWLSGNIIWQTATGALSKAEAALAWGPHAGLYATDGDITAAVSPLAETNALFATWLAGISGRTNLWNQAWAWDNHALAGYATTQQVAAVAADLDALAYTVENLPPPVTDGLPSTNAVPVLIYATQTVTEVIGWAYVITLTTELPPSGGPGGPLPPQTIIFPPNTVALTPAEWALLDPENEEREVIAVGAIPPVFQEGEIMYDAGGPETEISLYDGATYWTLVNQTAFTGLPMTLRWGGVQRGTLSYEYATRTVEYITTNAVPLADWYEQTLSLSRAVGQFVSTQEFALAVGPLASTQQLAAIAAQIPDVSGFATHSALAAATNDIVQTYLLATDAWMTVSNQTLTVWRVTDGVTNAHVIGGGGGTSVDPTATNLLWIALNSGLAEKAPKAWGTLAPDGSPNPDPEFMTFLNAPVVMHASGFQWATSGGHAVLAESGAVAFQCAGETGGELRIGPDVCSNYFGFVRGESLTIGATPSGIYVTNPGSEEGVAQIVYPYAGGDFPVLWFAPSLSVPFGVLEGVVWADQENGFAIVTAPATTASGFWYATTTLSVDAYFVSTMPARFIGGVVGGTNAAPVVYDSTVTITSGGKTYRIPAQEVE